MITYGIKYNKQTNKSIKISNIIGIKCQKYIYKV